MKKTEKSVDNARFSMSRMIKTGLLMNIVMRAFSGVMSGIKAGFDNLAQYSNGTNSCLSVLWGSLIRLQNSLATAFNPILTVITPILSRFIDLISTAITYVGMFSVTLPGIKHTQRHWQYKRLCCQSGQNRQVYEKSHKSSERLPVTS